MLQDAMIICFFLFLGLFYSFYYYIGLSFARIAEKSGSTTNS